MVMRKKNYFTIALLTIIMTWGICLDAFAAEWQRDDTGWWWKEEDGSWISGEWQWLDGNLDGIAECYYFDATGYMQANTITSDGYTVNSDGAWIVDGVIQTKETGGSTVVQNYIDENEYDEWGVNKTALAMFQNSREENAKYIEVKEDQTRLETTVYYDNGFLVSYPESASFYKKVMAVDQNLNFSNERLFQYYDGNMTSGNEAEDYLIGKGWHRGAYGPKACYADGATVWINAGEAVLNWNLSRRPSVIYLR